jgi:hypothetical protein
MATGKADATFLLMGGRSAVNDCRGVCVDCLFFVDDIPWCTYYRKKPDDMSKCSFCKVNRVVVEELA